MGLQILCNSERGVEKGWGWEVVGFITYNTKGSQNGDCVTYLGCMYMDDIYRYRGNE